MRPGSLFAPASTSDSARTADEDRAGDPCNIAGADGRGQRRGESLKRRDLALTGFMLAEKLACRKQNIDYHLRRALEFCPELEFALFSRKQRLRRRR